MRRILRKPRHFWGEMLFAMVSIGSGDSFLVNLAAFVADIILALVIISILLGFSHLVHAQ